MGKKDDEDKTKLPKVSKVEPEADITDDMDEDEEYEYELIMETGSRLADLAMALCSYNDELAKKALAIATGTLLGHFAEDPCVHELTEITEAHMEVVAEHHALHHAGELGAKKDDAGNN